MCQVRSIARLGQQTARPPRRAEGHVELTAAIAGKEAGLARRHRVVVIGEGVDRPALLVNPPGVLVIYDRCCSTADVQAVGLSSMPRVMAAHHLALVAKKPPSRRRPAASCRRRGCLAGIHRSAATDLRIKSRADAGPSRIARVLPIQQNERGAKQTGLPPCCAVHRDRPKRWIPRCCRYERFRTAPSGSHCCCRWPQCASASPGGRRRSVVIDVLAIAPSGPSVNSAFSLLARGGRAGQCLVRRDAAT